MFNRMFNLNGLRGEHSLHVHLCRAFFPCLCLHTVKYNCKYINMTCTVFPDGQSVADIVPG